MTFATPNITEMTRAPELVQVRIGDADGPVAPMATALFFAQVPRPTPRPDYEPAGAAPAAETPDAESPDADMAEAGAAAPAELRPALGIPVPTPRDTAVN